VSTALRKAASEAWDGDEAEHRAGEALGHALGKQRQTGAGGHGEEHVLHARFWDLHERRRQPSVVAHRDDRAVEGRVRLARKDDEALRGEPLEGDRGFDCVSVGHRQHGDRVLLAERRHYVGHVSAQGGW
jgi:hypothetical protein